jgi:hypothetical protein
MKKYFKTKKEAQKALEERITNNPSLKIFKMPKGTRRHGEYAVCTDIEYLNTY